MRAPRKRSSPPPRSPPAPVAPCPPPRSPPRSALPGREGGRRRRSRASAFTIDRSDDKTARAHRGHSTGGQTCARRPRTSMARHARTARARTRCAQATGLRSDTYDPLLQGGDALRSCAAARPRAANPGRRAVAASIGQALRAPPPPPPGQRRRRPPAIYFQHGPQRRVHPGSRRRPSRAAMCAPRRRSTTSPRSFLAPALPRACTGLRGSARALRRVRLHPTEPAHGHVPTHAARAIRTIP